MVACDRCLFVCLFLKCTSVLESGFVMPSVVPPVLSDWVNLGSLPSSKTLAALDLIRQQLSPRCMEQVQ